MQFRAVIGDHCMWCIHRVTNGSCYCRCVTCGEGRPHDGACAHFFDDPALARQYVRLTDPEVAGSVRVMKKWRALLHARLMPNVGAIVAAAVAVYHAHGAGTHCPICTAHVEPAHSHWRSGFCRGCFVALVDKTGLGQRTLIDAAATPPAPKRPRPASPRPEDPGHVAAVCVIVHDDGTVTTLFIKGALSAAQREVLHAAAMSDWNTAPAEMFGLMVGYIEDNPDDAELSALSAVQRVALAALAIPSERVEVYSFENPPPWPSHPVYTVVLQDWL